MSFGDVFVLIIFLLLLLEIFTITQLPTYSREVLLLSLLVPASLIVATFRFPNNTNLISGSIEIIKISASIFYFISIVALTQRDAVSRVYLFAFCTFLMILPLSIWTTIETLSGVRRPSGTFSNPNLYADYLLFSLSMVGLILNKEITAKQYYRAAFFIVPIPFIIISLFGTQSRSGIGALIIIIAVYSLAKWKSIISIYQNKLYLILSIIVTSGIASLLLSRSWGVIGRFQSVLAGGSTGGRFVRWAQSVDILITSSFIGVGWGQHRQYIESTISLHNSLVQITVELGILGAVLLVLIWLLAIRRGFQLSTKKNYSYTIYLTAFLTASVANSMFHNNLNFRTFWIVLGLIGSLELSYWRATSI